jgi:GNAT superfamily N-acetyltransferase
MPTLVRLIRFLEYLSIRAYPALEEQCDDGWLLRFAEGFTRRANSVHVLGPSTRPLAEKIAHSERWYRDRRLPPIVKLTGDPDAPPSELERALIDRGYTADRALLTTVRASAALPDEPPSPQTQIAIAPDPDWLRAYVALNDIAPERIPLKRALLARLRPVAGYARIADADGAIRAVALGVIERGWIGVFGVVVAADQRGRGLGTQLMRDLLAWGRAHGAQRSYLQVLDANRAARRLYDRLGYRDVYRYWYRQGGAPSSDAIIR